MDNINEYLYSSNKVIIDENIFNNFNNVVKKLKSFIKFQTDLDILSKILKTNSILITEKLSFNFT